MVAMFTIYVDGFYMERNQMFCAYTYEFLNNRMQGVTSFLAFLSWMYAENHKTEFEYEKKQIIW